LEAKDKDGKLLNPPPSPGENEVVKEVKAE